MTSGLEPVPVPSQKHDPAWKHCQMFKDGDKVQLKCVYCGKVFKGGGIHRIKEHLACQKGNASTCLRVPPDVQVSMQRSLDGVVAKKRNRQRLDEEITNITTPVARAEPVQMSLVGLHECNVVEHGLGLGLVGRDEKSGGDKRKRGRGRASSVGRSRAYLVGAINAVDSGLGSKMPTSLVQMAIGRFMYDIGAPLDAVDSPFFQPMIEAIASGGPGVASLTCHDLRGWILKNSLEEVRGDVESYRGSWEKTGCSVLVDELSPEPDSVVLCFHVNCPEGTVFLKTVDASGIVGSSDLLYELLREVVEEVGPTNVVQIVTSGNREEYFLAGVKLGETFPNLYWAPCGVRLIDTMLEDFGNIEWIREVIEQARSITRFVYNHGEILNIVRRYTFCDEIVERGLTRSAANFATLKRLVDLKHKLHMMVTSQEWVDCPCSKKSGGLDVMDVVSSESFWSSCILVVNLTSPLLRALTIVSDENRPAMGYIYAAMYRAKETVKKELVKKEEYIAFWDIIDQRWEYLRNFPLHSAGFFLNPKFFYSVEEDIPNDISSGLFDCIERLVSDTKVQDKIIKEISLYKNAAGDFGRKMALRTKETLLPAEWWSAYGGGCPNLARLAVRILSQTCSVIGCNKWDQDLVRKLHNTGNSLEHQRLSDLVFVHKNLKLRKMVGKRNGDDTVEEWVRRLEGAGDSDWMAIDPPPSATATTLVLQGNEGFDDLGVGSEDFEIFSRVKDGDDETVRDNVPLK